MFTETERAIMGDVYRLLKVWYDKPIDGDMWEDVIGQAVDLSVKYHAHPLAVHMVCAVLMFLEEQQGKGDDGN